MISEKDQRFAYVFLEQTLPKLRAPPSDFGGPVRGQELGVGAVVVLVGLEPGREVENM